MATLYFEGKVSDMFVAGSYDPVYDFEFGPDYVPHGLGIGEDDYLSIEVDIETGKIIGWDSEEIKRWISSNK